MRGSFSAGPFASFGAGSSPLNTGPSGFSSFGPGPLNSLLNGTGPSVMSLSLGSFGASLSASSSFGARSSGSGGTESGSSGGEPSAADPLQMSPPDSKLPDENKN